MVRRMCVCVPMFERVCVCVCAERAYDEQAESGYYIRYSRAWISYTFERRVGRSHIFLWRRTGSDDDACGARVVVERPRYESNLKSSIVCTSRSVCVVLRSSYHIMEKLRWLCAWVCVRCVKSLLVQENGFWMVKEYDAGQVVFYASKRQREIWVIGQVYILNPTGRVYVHVCLVIMIGEHSKLDQLVNSTVQCNNTRESSSICVCTGWAYFTM